MTKPNSPSCERNREPILKILKKIIHQNHKKLLEIGSGTGQHAVYFAPEFESLEWTTSDVLDNHEAIKSWIKDCPSPNIKGPIELEVGKNEIPSGFDLVFSANVIHIMAWEKVKQLFSLFDQSLDSNSELIFYGPFNYGGKFTSDSNANFDQWLKNRDPKSGIRSFEEVCESLGSFGFNLVFDYEMPANNRMLHFRRD